MNNQEFMPLGAAIAALGELDAIYFSLYQELASLRGEAPCGPLGARGYSNLRQVLTAVRLRKEQIEQLKHDITKERNCDGSEVATELRSLFSEFGIKV